MNEETVMQPEYDFCRSTVRGFCRLSTTSLEALARDLGLLSDTDALCLWQGHFSGQERRDPLVGELRFFDRLTQQGALSPKSLRVSALRFESQKEERIWQDICQKRKELGETRFYPSLPSLMGLCTRYLDRLGFSTAKRGLTCTQALRLGESEKDASLSLSQNGISAVLSDKAQKQEQAQAAPKLILYFVPNEGEELEGAVAALLKKAAPYGLRPFARVQKEGIWPHLATLDGGIVVDIARLPEFDAQKGFCSVLGESTGGMLLFAHEQTAAALLSEHTCLRVIGKQTESGLFWVKNGAESLVCCEHKFVKRICTAPACELHIPTDSAPFSAEVELVENDTLLLCGTQTPCGAERAVLALLVKAVLGGADPSRARLGAVLCTPPLDTPEKKAEALRLVLQLHRATAELCLPVSTHEEFLDFDCGTPTLSLFLAAEKCEKSPEIDAALLQKAQNDGDFAAVRKILFENS